MRWAIMGWLVGGDREEENGDRPFSPVPTAPGGDVAVVAMTEPALSRYMSHTLRSGPDIAAGKHG